MCKERLRISTLLLIILKLTLSCSQQTALIVSDPYVDTVGHWGLHDRLFGLRLRLIGISAAHDTVSDDRSLPDIIAELADIPDIIVLSPWSVDEAIWPILKNSNVIIVGGIPLENTPGNVRGVAMDTTAAFTDIGRIAGNIALDKAKPALLLHRSGVDELLEAYEIASESLYPILDYKVSSDEIENPLPEDFAVKAADASVLLLFAGQGNILAYQATEDMQQPIITELAFSNGNWNNRIIASIENDERKMKKALLSVLGNRNQNLVVYYPGKLEM